MTNKINPIKLIDFFDLLYKITFLRERLYLIAPKEQPPRKLSGKWTVELITLESRHGLTEGLNLSGKKTDGDGMSYYGNTKNSALQLS